MNSYLAFSFVVFAAGVMALAASGGSKRRFLFWSALLAAPTGLADRWFTPDYWQPDHVFGPAFSVEGVLFSFGNGAIVAFAVWPLIRGLLSEVRREKEFGAVYMRLVATMTPGFLVFLALWDGLAGPLPVMQASFCGFVVLALWLVARRCVDLRAGLVGAGLFAGIYWGQTLLWSLFDPHIARFWPRGTAYLADRLPINGLPGDEILWAAFYGFLWPHIIAAALAPQRAQDRRRG